VPIFSTGILALERLIDFRSAFIDNLKMKKNKKLNVLSMRFGYTDLGKRSLFLSAI
jgi:hypothetical protein